MTKELFARGGCRSQSELAMRERLKQEIDRRVAAESMLGLAVAVMPGPGPGANEEDGCWDDYLINNALLCRFWSALADYKTA